VEELSSVLRHNVSKRLYSFKTHVTVPIKAKCRRNWKEVIASRSLSQSAVVNNVRMHPSTFLQ